MSTTRPSKKLKQQLKPSKVKTTGNNPPEKPALSLQEATIIS
jgi:hypothetical protein